MYLIFGNFLKTASPNLNKLAIFFKSLSIFIFSQRKKNIVNLLVRSAFKSNNQPGTFKRTRTRCKTCPFISYMIKISGRNRSVKITDYFTCISSNVICCITCTLCKKISETGRRLADRYREHLRDLRKKTTQMCQNQLRVILIFLITPTTT